MRIRMIDDFNDFIALKKSWVSLLSRCDHTVFSTWDWLTIWWKHFGSNRELILLLAEENDEVVGAAPLMYSVHATLGLRTAKIEFIGTPTSDYNNFILGEKGEECMKLFADYLLNDFPDKWDSLDLKEIPEGSQSLILLKRMSRKLEVVSLRSIHYCLHIPVPKSYDILYNNLNYKFRQNLRRCQSHLEQYHKVEFRDLSSTNECDKGMETLFDLHQKRWETAGQQGVFADKKICDFNRDVARTLSESGRLGLYSIVVDGAPVGSSYGFKYNSKYYYYLHGVDPEYNKFSIGNLLVAGLLKECIHGGLTEFDFLRGDEPYKYRWTSLGRKNIDIALMEKKIYSRLEYWLAREYSFQGKKLKRMLKT